MLKWLGKYESATQHSRDAVFHSIGIPRNALSKFDTPSWIEENRNSRKKHCGILVNMHSEVANGIQCSWRYAFNLHPMSLSICARRHLKYFVQQKKKHFSLHIFQILLVNLSQMEFELECWNMHPR